MYGLRAFWTFRSWWYAPGPGDISLCETKRGDVVLKEAALALWGRRSLPVVGLYCPGPGESDWRVHSADWNRGWLPMVDLALRGRHEGL